VIIADKNHIERYLCGWRRSDFHAIHQSCRLLVFERSMIIFTNGQNERVIILYEQGSS